MGVVYVKNDCVVRWSQGQSPLALGDVWDDKAPLVVERPDLFDVEPTRVRGRQAQPVDQRHDEDQEPPAEPPTAPVVETATAQPGTKRPAARTTAARTKRKV
ncbi:hypothetical protein [Nonomuraea sp. NPDC050786]|uniref:hypothetical protein n=1 Tax=Nonomuraea sp. NPDC050786 TaxID=3154840 RepID=UPI0033CD3B6D